MSDTQIMSLEEIADYIDSLGPCGADLLYRIYLEMVDQPFDSPPGVFQRCADAVITGKVPYQDVG